MEVTMNDKAHTTIREAVGLFTAADKMEAAIEDLEENGFDRAEISLLASEDTVREKLGHRFYDAKSLEDNPRVPRAAFVSTEALGDAEGALIGVLMYAGALAAAGMTVASGGTFGALLVAAIGGGASGGLIGGVLAGIVGEDHASKIEAQLKHGGLLVWVRTSTPADEQRAVEVLKRNDAHDVHVHDIEV
jgi:hypothetical protein